LKSNPLLPAEDYELLRKQGIKYIEKLGSDLWTDYNTSDPGITILEAVCYTITDLAYRTGFEVKDLLAPESLTDETWKQIFYTARQILHISALTINDYRKLIIDVEGVRNAWIEPSKDYEVPFWINYNYYNKQHGHSCSGEAKICYGQLGLDPVSEDQKKQFVQERQDQLKKESNKLTVTITELTAKITELDSLAIKEKDTTNDPVRLQAFAQQKSKASSEKSNLENKVKLLQEESVAIGKAAFIPSKIVEIEGLYNVMIEYEEDILEDSNREKIRQKVVDRLSRHRNLCEDFLSINAVEYQDFSVAASIVLEEYADPDTVLAQIFFTIYKYFTPSIPFYTIDQMIQKGHSTEEIFEGPALRHGFIDEEDLENTDLFRDIRLSDIISEVSDIEGIIAINYLQLPFNGFDDGGKDYFNEWINHLRNERKIARLQPSSSPIMFCRERDFITYNLGRPNDRNPARMLKLYKDLKSVARKYKLEGAENDFRVPVGENMELEDYYPITYSLPMCYGVSEHAGLPANADDKRKIQALQLKGYLLFFEQILGGYLVQLNHLRDLFSFDDSVKYTYFTKALTEIMDFQSLLIDHGDRGQDHYKQILHDFTEVLENLVETPKIFADRRNKFLDHMLARFGEDLSEYESLTKWLTPYKAEERLIKDKSRILKDGEYYKISTNRGKGYNYADPETWNTDNVSGTERRISRLLGFGDARRRSLFPTFTISEPVMELDAKKVMVRKKNKKNQLLNVVKFIDPDNNNQTLLTSVEVIDGCCTDLLMGDIIEHANDRRYFKFHNEINQRSRKSAGLAGSFWFELFDSTDPETSILLATSERFEKSDLRENAFKRLQKLMMDINNNEGIHLVEHLLLRPKLDEVLDEANKEQEVKFLDVCLDICDLGIGLGEKTEVPPYRKRVRRIPADKCYDQMPWILEYIRFNSSATKYDQSILFEETFTNGTESTPIKFRRYELLAQRVKDLHEYGSERINYKIISNQEDQPEKIKYSFVISGSRDKKIAQSPFLFNKRTKQQINNRVTIEDDIEVEIGQIIRYFRYELDLYCQENPCDNNEDPYSFRTTAVLPCWPKRFRDPTFRNLVEKTIQTESPSHIHTRVVWVGISEMERFEKAYFEWLKEMAQTEMPSYDRVNPLVTVLNTLKTCRTCEDDCSHE